MKRYFLLGQLFFWCALAHAQPAALTDCAELLDPARKSMVDACVAYAPCKIMIQPLATCEKAKVFIDRLDGGGLESKLLSFFSGKKKELDAETVFEAAVPETKYEPDWLEKFRMVRERVRGAGKDVLTGKSTNNVAWVYVGDVLDGKKQGLGTQFWETGQVIRGSFDNDTVSGEADLVNAANGLRAVGEFRDGLLNGEAWRRGADGNLYKGSFVNGRPHGQGLAAFVGGSSYDGNWIDGQRSGKGIYRWKDGDSHEGDWKAGSREGPGVYRYADGSVFTGTWQNNKRTGPGTFRWPNGGSLKANFVNNEAEGTAAYIDAQGNSSTRVYKAGKVVSDTASSRSAAPAVSSAPSAPARPAADAFAFARQACDAELSRCNGVCTGVAAISIFSIVKGGDADQTSGATESCFSRCEAEKSTCDRKVAQMESDAAPPANANPKTAGSGTTPAAPSASVGQTTSSYVGGSSSSLVEISLSSRWSQQYDLKKLRFPIAAYTASDANIKACQQKNGAEGCMQRAYQYDLGNFQNPFVLKAPEKRTYPYTRIETDPSCKYTPHSYSVTPIERQAPEITCKQLLLQAIHEQMEWAVGLMRTGTGLLGSWASTPAVAGTSSGNCKADLAALDKEAARTRGRVKTPEQHAQLGMFLAANKFRILERSCKGTPEYEAVHLLRQQAGDLHRACSFGKTDTSMCVPKLP